MKDAMKAYKIRVLGLCETGVRVSHPRLHLVRCSRRESLRKEEGVSFFQRGCMEHCRGSA
jgi:hypothetical protein